MSVPNQISILFLAASPVDEVALELTREFEDIRHELRARRPGRFLIESQWHTKATDLPWLLVEQQPHVLHFSGHGLPTGELLFEGEDGYAHPADAQAVARVFELVGSVRCVVLNACYAEEQAKLIARHVDIVIGMSDQILDADARQFAKGFYEAIGLGQSVGKAFELAKVRLQLSGSDGHHVLRLHTRLGVDAEQVFVEGAPARTDVTPLEAMKAQTGPTYEPPHHESALEQRLRGFPRRPIHRLTRPPPPGCPRDALLDELARGLHPPSHCVALLGPPGTGRRWLARTHALTRAAAYTTIWQIRGSNRTTIALDLAELAVEIGIAELSSDPRAARDVGLWLRQAPDWLLIIEDLGSLDDLHSLVPLHGPGHVLLVGAPSLDLPEWIERVTVPALDQDDATNLLRAAAGWSEETFVHELLTEYGTLPGELRWAGQLAQLFGHNPAQLLASLRSLSDGRYGALVEYVQRSVTVSAQLSLLTLCAYLGPVPIPVAVLDQMYRSGPDRIREVLPPKDDIVQSIARLEELGLLTCNVGHLHVDTKIVRALRWSTSDRCESWENIVLALVATLVDGNEFVRVADFDLDVAFVPLLRHVIDHIACNDHRQDAFARALSISAVAYEKYSDEPHAAIRDYERAIELIEHCKTPNTFNLATMYLNVGRMHGRQGRHADAIAAFTRARSILAIAPTKNRKFRYVLTHYIAESQTHLRLLEAAAASWSTCSPNSTNSTNPLRWTC